MKVNGKKIVVTMWNLQPFSNSGSFSKNDYTCSEKRSDLKIIRKMSKFTYNDNDIQLLHG